MLFTYLVVMSAGVGVVSCPFPPAPLREGLIQGAILRGHEPYQPTLYRAAYLQYECCHDPLELWSMTV